MSVHLVTELQKNCPVNLRCSNCHKLSESPSKDQLSLFASLPLCCSFNWLYYNICKDFGTLVEVVVSFCTLPPLSVEIFHLVTIAVFILNVVTSCSKGGYSKYFSLRIENLMVEHWGWYSDKKVLSPPPCRLIFHAAIEKNLNDIQVIRHIQWQNVILSTKENKIFSFSSGKLNTILYFCVYILYFDIKKSFPHGWCGFVIKDH